MISDSEAEEYESGICCATGCENSSDKGYTMKRFPKDKKLREIWLCNMGKSNDDWEPNDNSFLCHSHFTDPDQWTVTSNDKIVLKEDAIPTLFVEELEQNPKRSQQVVGNGRTDDSTMAYDEIEENLRKICDEGDEQSQDKCENDTSKSSSSSSSSSNSSSSKRKIVEQRTSADNAKRVRVESNGAQGNQKQSKTTNGTSEAGEKSDFWAKKLKDAIQESIKEQENKKSLAAESRVTQEDEEEDRSNKKERKVKESRITELEIKDRRLRQIFLNRAGKSAKQSETIMYKVNFQKEVICKLSEQLIKLKDSDTKCKSLTKQLRDNDVELEQLRFKCQKLEEKLQSAESQPKVINLQSVKEQQSSKNLSLSNEERKNYELKLKNKETVIKELNVKLEKAGKFLDRAEKNANWYKKKVVSLQGVIRRKDIMEKKQSEPKPEPKITLEKASEILEASGKEVYQKLINCGVRLPALSDLGESELDDYEPDFDNNQIVICRTVQDIFNDNDYEDEPLEIEFMQILGGNA